MPDQRRFDLIEKVVADLRRSFEDAVATILARLGAHTHGSGVDARYERRSGTQSIPNVTDTRVEFPTGAYTSSSVTPGGTNNQYFHLTEGLWIVDATTRWQTSDHVRHMWLATGTTVGTSTRFGSTVDQDDVGGATTLNVAGVVNIPSGGDYVHVGVFHDTGAAANLEGPFGGEAHIALTWLRRRP
ncbi:MAG: hypothetical protein M3460_17600 [Actinomycetota bacterium]|nr:hypothetical protein [Actinomycetota bacterium]